MRHNSAEARRAVVIGAGIGGLAAAAHLLAAGLKVTVVERGAAPGGKISTIPSGAGPVAAGPTVLTLKPVFEALFAALGARLEDHMALTRLPLLARHFWPDGGRLDLFDSPDASRDAIRGFAGPRDAAAFAGFHREAAALFTCFDTAFLQAAVPALPRLALAALRNPALLPALLPGQSLAARLSRRFRDPRLAQLFGRYATYVGGSPYHSPALLALIWQAEAGGVWRARDGLQALPDALTALCRAHGARFRFNAEAARIETERQGVTGLRLADGTLLPAGTIVFNGDPRALALGALGQQAAAAAPQTRKAKRSLSARVWSFAARARGAPLAHHNVFFARSPRAEFDDLSAGRMPRDPTLYICAMDRGADGKPAPAGLERFEIILNAPPLTQGQPPPEEFETCRIRTFETLRAFGLSFTPEPGPDTLAGPQTFEHRFPMSAGSLYGQSPHGLLAALRRPRARTPVPGLYLAGGGCHPGAGLPMAALSGRHAAEAILRDLALPWRCPRTATPGGMPTGSAATASGPSQ